MWPYSAFGVFTAAIVRNWSTWRSRRLTTTGGAPRAVRRVAGLVPIRDVDTLEVDEPVEERLAVAVPVPIRLHELADQLLALADDDEVHERRDRLRVRERAHPAHQHERVVRAAVGRAQRDAGHVQQPQDVDVVPLVRHREADHLEVGQRPLGLERQRRRRSPSHLVEVGRIGEEDALADHVAQRVQVAVDRLEAEVGHADGVGVRVDERDRDAAAPVLADRPLLLGQQDQRFILYSS
jgi:hypothetical protein